MVSIEQFELPRLHPETTAAELGALLHGTGVSPLSLSGWIRVTGDDRVRWLNGMTTNSVQHLAPGEGAYSFFLNAQGRIQGDGTIFAEPNALWIETDRSQVAGLMTLLNRFIIMDDVELADVSSEWSGLLIAGPQAASLLENLELEADARNPLNMRQASWNQLPVRVVHAYSPLVPRYEIWLSEDEQSTAFTILKALLSAGGVLCEAESLEQLRVLEGTPVYGVDIRERELPQETGQERALHFAKGCYLGQEIVERIRSRGNVHRTFRGFHLEGTLPGIGAILQADGKPVGELTSVAAIPFAALSATPSSPPARMVQLALGYVRRDALDRASTLLYEGGIASPLALPISPLSIAAAALPRTSASDFIGKSLNNA